MVTEWNTAAEHLQAEGAKNLPSADLHIQKKVCRLKVQLFIFLFWKHETYINKFFFFNYYS